MVKRPRIPEPSPGPDNSTKDELDAAEGENLGSRDFPFLKEKSEFHREEKTRDTLLGDGDIADAFISCYLFHGLCNDVALRCVQHIPLVI